MKVLDEGRLESALLTLAPTFLPGKPECGEPEGDEVAVWVKNRGPAASELSLLLGFRRSLGVASP